MYCGFKDQASARYRGKKCGLVGCMIQGGKNKHTLRAGVKTRAVFLNADTIGAEGNIVIHRPLSAAP